MNLNQIITHTLRGKDVTYAINVEKEDLYHENNRVGSREITTIIIGSESYQVSLTKTLLIETDKSRIKPIELYGVIVQDLENDKWYRINKKELKRGLFQEIYKRVNKNNKKAKVIGIKR